MKTKNEALFLAPGVRSGTFRKLKGRSIQGKQTLLEEYLRVRGTRRPGVWVSDRASVFAPLAEVVQETGGDLRLLLLDPEVRPAQREFLSTLFSSVVTPGQGIKLLPDEELTEVLNSEDREYLFIGGSVDDIDRVVVLIRGDLDRLIIPFAWFSSRESTAEPDFADFEVTDYGQTLRFGSFEVATDAILYEFDAEYRRRAKHRALDQDHSFGGALRRLRLQKGVSREDFPRVSAKEIARIERGEVERPRESTLRAIADRLGVPPEEIATY